MSELNETVCQMKLTGIYKISYLTAAEYTFFSLALRIFPKIDHRLDDKANIYRLKKMK
jgi:hypothetical protein